MEPTQDVYTCWVQIHWPCLNCQLWIQMGLLVPTSTSWEVCSHFIPQCMHATTPPYNQGLIDSQRNVIHHCITQVIIGYRVTECKSKRSAQEKHNTHTHTHTHTHACTNTTEHKSHQHKYATQTQKYKAGNGQSKNKTVLTCMWFLSMRPTIPKGKTSIQAKNLS